MKSDSDHPPDRDSSSRRAFIKSSLYVASGAVGGSLALANAASALGSETIRVGLIGCGKRGTAATIEALATSGGEVRLAAMGDVFADRLQAAYRALRSRHGVRAELPASRRFAGIDAYQNVLESDVDLVILATPPVFRPLHFEAAVRSGKHTFLERPVAVDAAGIDRVRMAGREARQRSLAVAVGFQRRHEPAIRETVARLQEGMIGDILLLRAYGNCGIVPMRPTRGGESALESQLRNWRQYHWLGGDALVEQHVQNLDLMNWVKQTLPGEVQGQGGNPSTLAGDSPLARSYHFLEFTYPDGARLLSQCRRMPGCWNSLAAHVHGTRGRADVTGGKIYDLAGRLIWCGKASRSGHQRQQNRLFAALRSGEALDELETGIGSTMTALLGQTASQTRRRVRWGEDSATGTEYS